MIVSDDKEITDLLRSHDISPTQQRVEIAKAISQESSLLIMDEPTAALGLAETEHLLQLINVDLRGVNR